MDYLSGSPLEDMDQGRSDTVDEDIGTTEVDFQHRENRNLKQLEEIS